MEEETCNNPEDAQARAPVENGVILPLAMGSLKTLTSKSKRRSNQGR